jgi:hypothetical protein
MSNTFYGYLLVAGCFALGTAYAADDKTRSVLHHPRLPRPPW